jgi:hypothetical protein
MLTGETFFNLVACGLVVLGTILAVLKLIWARNGGDDDE